MHPHIHTEHIEIKEPHIDINGHVNNVQYVQWMQQVAYHHSAKVGYDMDTLDAQGATWFIRSHYIHYHRPAQLGETLIAHTWPYSAKKFSALRKYKFVRASDQAVMVTGESEWVFIDKTTGRPRIIDDSIRAAFPLVPESEEP